MSRSILAMSLVTVALIVTAGVVYRSVNAADQKQFVEAKVKPTKQELRDFMRKKLAASNQILEGLALEDTDLIKEGANTLAEMSAAESWRVSQDAMYRQFSDEFSRSAKKLVEAANEKNIDRAALRWMDATLGCIECHRFVRNELVVKAAE